jgi:lysyl-tRNA synthetase class I
MNKEAALKANGIESMYDPCSDRYYLRRTKPAEHMQLTFDRNQFEYCTTNDIYNMFDNHYRQQEDFVHLGPTNAELRDPRIRYAWEELQILRKLIGAK